MKKAPEAFRTISEVAEILKTPAHVLRFWESKFYQIRPVKRAGGRRYYRPDDVTLINGIRILLQEQGMTIRGVQRVLQENGVKHVTALGAELAMSPDAAGDISAVESAELAVIEGKATSLPIADTVEPVSGPVSGSARAQPDTIATEAAAEDADGEPAEDAPAPTVVERAEPSRPVPPVEPALPVAKAPEAPGVPDPAPTASAETQAPKATDEAAEPSAEDPAAAPVMVDRKLDDTSDGDSIKSEAPDAPRESAEADDTPTTSQVAEASAASAPAMPEADSRPRIAQILRATPRGQLGTTHESLEHLSRRIDVFLDRMSEASGAGRW
ncbi:MerR family transcriptional regulator [Pararhodobacter oceanensis]|uniref:MerR family transcriptional regulator n=1 Tax=Pararhodobacter oceanensis TaxID=2172121 RepID=UPI003A95B292